jgi:hypothetical protein
VLTLDAVKRGNGMRSRLLVLVACAVVARSVLVANVRPHFKYVSRASSCRSPGAVAISIAPEIGVDVGLQASSVIDRRLTLEIVTMPLMAAGENLALSRQMCITHVLQYCC